MKILPDEPCPCGSNKLFKDCHGPKIKEEKIQITEYIPLKVIPEPDPGRFQVFDMGKDGKFRSTSTSIAMTCGKCQRILAEGMSKQQILNAVLKCSCGAFNLIE